MWRLIILMFKAKNDPAKPQPTKLDKIIGAHNMYSWSPNFSNLGPQYKKVEIINGVIKKRTFLQGLFFTKW